MTIAMTEDLSLLSEPVQTVQNRTAKPKKITYLITLPPDSKNLSEVYHWLCRDIAVENAIGQLFFYSDAVFVGSAEYTEKTAAEGSNCGQSDDLTVTEPNHSAMAKLIDCADSHGIPLYLCSAGFQKRGLSLSDTARQDFSFKGLGQFIVESRDTDDLRVDRTIATASEFSADLFCGFGLAAAYPSGSPAYTHLIALRSRYATLQTREFLDIALVSASYDIDTAVFISKDVVATLKANPTPAVRQAVNMLSEFEVPLFSDHSDNNGNHSIAGHGKQPLVASHLTALQNESRHHLLF